MYPMSNNRRGQTPFTQGRIGDSGSELRPLTRLQSIQGLFAQVIESKNLTRVKKLDIIYIESKKNIWV